MKKAQIRKIPSDVLPPVALRAFLDAFSSIQKIQRHYFPEFINPMDVEDTQAEAILEGLEFALNKVKEEPTSLQWTRERWFSQIMRRFQNAILEYTNYVYLPVTIPRPLRFSLKKYVEALRIITKYVKSMTKPVHTVDLYYILCVVGCNPLPHECPTCHLGYSECPIDQMSAGDRKELYNLLMGPKKSLTFYAQWYRKSYLDWIRLLELLYMYSVSPIIPEIPVTYDIDGSLDLSRFNGRLRLLHPDLYEIYLETLETIDIQELNASLTIKTPFGWSSKDIKDRHRLTTQQYRELLVAGDRVLNQFRTDAGLQRIRRDFSG